MYSWLSRSCTARGSSTGFSWLIPLSLRLISLENRACSIHPFIKVLYCNLRNEETTFTFQGPHKGLFTMASFIDIPRSLIIVKWAVHELCNTGVGIAHSLLVAHWLSVTGDRGSNSGGKFMLFCFLGPDLMIAITLQINS